MIFEIYYSYKDGPTKLHGIEIKTQSPKGSVRLKKEGCADKLANELLQLEEDLKENYSETRRSDKIYTDDFFTLCSQLGCNILGSSDEKEEFLKTLEIDGEIQDATKIFHDDCGAEIWTIALFRDSKYYYNIECVRTWPGYEP